MEQLTECFNDVWCEDRFPEEWKEETIKPMFKKGDKEAVENYKRITLIHTGYKIYEEYKKEDWSKKWKEEVF